MTLLPAGLDEVLRRYRSALELEFPGRVRKVTLFGSMARGDATEDSDVDVLVVVDGLTSGERGRAIDRGAEAGLDRGFVLVPVALSSSEWGDVQRSERLLACEIQRDGVDV